MAESKFTSNKKQIERSVEQAIGRALEICGGTAERYAKEICPVDTGRLRNSIAHAQVDSHTESVGSNVEYAPYVELGTRYQRAQPYLRPAVEDHRVEYEKIIKSELGI